MELPIPAIRIDRVPIDVPPRREAGGQFNQQFAGYWLFGHGLPHPDDPCAPDCRTILGPQYRPVDFPFACPYPLARHGEDQGSVRGQDGGVNA